MASSPEFVEHAIDLLSGVGPIDARRMFGGHGVFAQGLMFAILDDDELFLKTDELTLPEFEAAGCRRWTFVAKGERVDTAYFRPPDEAHEDAESMLPWARLAVDSALRKAAAKAARTKPSLPRAAGGAAPASRAAPRPAPRSAPRSAPGTAPRPAPRVAPRSAPRAAPRAASRPAARPAAAREKAPGRKQVTPKKPRPEPARRRATRRRSR